MRSALVGGLLLAILLFVEPAWAQETRGTILGRVTDRTDAVVPGAIVRLRHVETNTTRETQTNDLGNYSAPRMPAGIYEISVEKPGFKRYVREGLTLRLNDYLEVNISLELGAVSEVMTVTAESPLLETANASIGKVVDSRRAADLPMPVGNTFDLIRLAGAVNIAVNNFSMDQPWEPWTNAGFTMAGSRARTATFTVDGANSAAADVTGNGATTPGFSPPPDAVAEMKVQTATFDGSVGMTEGGVVNVSIKSGTNTPHGTAFFSFIPTALTANLWFSNKNALKRPDSHAVRGGGVLNGPIYIPKIYNGKDKSFFMFSYEKTDYASIRSSLQTVPTAEQRAGDLSGLLKIGPQYQIYNPFSRRSIGSGRYQQDPIPNNIITNIRPVDPIATALLNPKNYLLPTGPGDTADGTNNYPTPNATQQVGYYTLLGRVDHNFSEKHRMYFRANKTSTSMLYPPVIWGPDSLYSTSWFWNRGRGFTMDHVYLLSPTQVLNFRVSTTAWLRGNISDPRGAGIDLTTFGWPASFNNLWNPAIRRVPQIRLADFTGFSGAAGNLLGTTGSDWAPQETRDLSVNYDKIVGAHGLKAGFQYQQLRMSYYTSLIAALGGDYTFDATYTKGPYDNSTTAPGSRGQGLAALLLGLPSSGTGQIADNWTEMSTIWAGFFQDDWKVSRKLTLNLSLRYEIEGPLTERYNRTVRDFDPTAKHSGDFDATVAAAYALNPIKERPLSDWSTLGGLRYAGVNGVPREVMNRDKNNFMPRVGFAFTVDNRTVIRGGYGMYYGILGQRRQPVIPTNFSADTAVVPTLDNGLTFVATLRNPFPNGLQQPLRASQGADTYMGKTITYFSPDLRAPRTQKLQVGVQRELPNRFLTEISFIHSRGDQLQTNRNPKFFPNKYLSTLPTRDQATINYWTGSVQNPFSGLLPGTGLNGSVIARQQLIRNFPQFTGMTDQTNEGRNWYHALTARIERRFAQGFTVSFDYTLSKTMDEVSFLNENDPKPEHVISSSDFPHRLQASFILEMPFGRGRRLLPNINRFGSAIVSGWQVSGSWMWQSGAPLGFGDAIYTGSRIEDVVLPADQRNVWKWFDTTNFEKTSAKQLDYHLRVLSSRFAGIRAPKLNQWDMSLLKNTKISEKMSAQFRLEALNALNSVWFRAPNTTPSSTSFGQITAEGSQPRKVQVQFKFLF
ncbi:MAG: carboxypeptidase regulatory-like domain-containing protein [Bryobacteraceae bacterium]